jgi:hypothetical protein
MSRIWFTNSAISIGELFGAGDPQAKLKTTVATNMSLAILFNTILEPSYR